jgi:YfiH family protein
MPFINHFSNGVVYMAAPNLQATHAFTTRFGGVSQGIYSSLNLGVNSGDNLVLIRENYERICQVLDITIFDIVCSHQIHSANVRIVTRGDCGQLFKPTTHKADALITKDPGVALMVFSADCVPILLHDPIHNVIGAIHAGWRGTAENIAGAAIHKMVSEFGCNPNEISAAIGPCISKCCYETDRDVMSALVKTMGEDANGCITARNNKYMVDLKEANRLLLHRAGLYDIMVSEECTSCQNDKYWSHRRTNGQRGSQVAIIVLITN